MGLMKAIFRSKVTKGARQFVGATHVPNGVAHSPGRVSLQTKVVAPPPIPEDSPVKAPDAGKNVAVLSKAVRQQTGDDVAMGGPGSGPHGGGKGSNKTPEHHAHELMQKIASQIRTGSAPGKSSYFTTKEIAEEFGVHSTAVAGLVDKLKPLMEAKGIKLEYQPSIRKTGTSGRNSFGKQGRATSTNIESRVKWSVIPKSERGTKASESTGVAMGAGWAQAIRQKLQGEKKAKAARRKSDKADAAAAAQRRAAMPQATGPVAPFVPRVQLGGPGSGPHSVAGPKPVATYKPYVAPKQSFFQKAAGKVKDIIGVKAPGPAPKVGPVKIGALTIGSQKHAEEKVTESKDHPINPLNIKAPKGSSQAPGKSIGPIHVAMAAKSKVLTAKINRPTTAVKRVKAVLRKGKGKAAAQRKAPKNMAMAEVKK